MRRFMINKPIQELDLISELPGPIIQHIMSLIPYKEAARMSVLSKRFASAWNCFPIIILDETLIMGSCLELTESRSEQPNNGIENAIAYAIENKVKELELDIVGQGLIFKAHYNLPRKVLSCQSITVLSLKGFVLESSQNLTLNFPFIKELKLEKCTVMQTLNISSQTLKSVVIEFCQDLEKININASNLESFSLSGGPDSSSSINITACKSLKYLSLKNAQITDEWIKHEVAQFFRLEVLKVVGCRLLKNFHVSDTNLKTVDLRNCSQLQKIEIYARSLNTFVYHGHLMPSEVFIDSPSFRAKISLSVDLQLPHDWFSRLRDFLSCFDHCEELEIACEVGKALIVPIDFRVNSLPPLYDLNYLKLVAKFPTNTEDLLDLLESLLWFAPHLTILSFVSGRKEKSLKFEYDPEIAIEGDLECCYSLPIKCWQHSLKKVIVENFEERENMVLEKFLAQKGIRMEATSREDNACADAKAGGSEDSGSVIIRNVSDLRAIFMSNFFGFDDI
ncbi:unnamed protein product [Dovyalis caffra]|uniref:F-box domain-containing protein n=1 Tax=Dovyalis caffra TaxID=77055 RepID=A0AAV1SI32_9ROSI|nr:unnamed protein product [Dovyalis caffra]